MNEWINQSMKRRLVPGNTLKLGHSSVNVPLNIKRQTEFEIQFIPVPKCKYTYPAMKRFRNKVNMADAHFTTLWILSALTHKRFSAFRPWMRNSSSLKSLFGADLLNRLCWRGLTYNTGRTAALKDMQVKPANVSFFKMSPIYKHKKTLWKST